jgi:hypothetical protein
MALGGKKKEMLFILGQFFRETNKRFGKANLKMSVSKAEFIDVIRGLKAVSTQERAIYRNLENLQKERYIVYGERSLRMSRKGYNEYERIRKEAELLRSISDSIKAGRIRFKRKIQTKLK